MAKTVRGALGWLRDACVGLRLDEAGAGRCTTPLHWERTWRGTRLVGSVMPEARRGSAEL